MSDPEREPADERVAKALAGTGFGKAADGSVAGAIGGVWGIVDSVLPGLLFVVVYTITRLLVPSLVAAVGAGLVLLAIALIRRQPVGQAIGGFVGVAICAVFSLRSGNAASYFVPGFFITGSAAVLYAVSIFVRWPLIGIIVGYLRGEAWREDPAKMRLYRGITWMWVGMFGLRLAIQLPLYFTDHVVALGTLRLVLGVPLFALVIWISWLIIRQAPATPGDQARPLRLR
ncbi:DUF3159 domain-containing protein [Spelaeicoccus albus]|uniref:DUF3159 domain-containing protein n=1 Tax=Spelaeicoccus albus TaxID=1280376 RepID=A0A7Z0II46_9MICO|nr:DUF3159 domain-containing protein [Spelaeicoccus albus]NYI68165.1 hypothetical protein [Spelaeicoccus albus]